MGVVGLVNHKGGVGKTTLAVHLAGAWALAGARVLLIDADPQGSALDWAAARAERRRAPLFGVVGVPRPTLHREAAQFRRDYDWIVIDAPPGAAAVTRSALLAADAALIPVQPSPYDLWAVTATVRLVEEATTYQPLRAALVVNRRIIGTVIGRAAQQAAAGCGLPALTTVVSQRVIFAEAAAAGRVAQEIDPRGAAAQEIAALTAEVEAMLYASEKNETRGVAPEADHRERGGVDSGRV